MLRDLIKTSASGSSKGSKVMVPSSVSLNSVNTGQDKVAFSMQNDTAPKATIAFNTKQMTTMSTKQNTNPNWISSKNNLTASNANSRKITEVKEIKEEIRLENLQSTGRDNAYEISMPSLNNHASNDIYTVNNNDNNRKKTNANKDLIFTNCNYTDQRMSGNSSGMRTTSKEDDYANRWHTWEGYIGRIKANGIDKGQKQLQLKVKKKDKLQNNVDILNSHIRTIHREDKVNGKWNKVILTENERLLSSSTRANQESVYMNKILPGIREEIEEMKSEISRWIQETKILRNDYWTEEREIMSRKDEIKKANAWGAAEMKNREKAKNEFMITQKHIEWVRERIKILESGTQEFLNSAKILADESDIYKKKI